METKSEFYRFLDARAILQLELRAKRPLNQRYDINHSMEKLFQKKTTWKDIHEVDRRDMLIQILRERDLLGLKFLVPDHISTQELLDGRALISHVNGMGWAAGYDYLVDYDH